MMLLCDSARAAEARIIARFVPEAGSIADAAILGTDHIALLYPAEGRIADYSLEGRLMQHIIREGGAELQFQPTACTEGPDLSIWVFDEAAHRVFQIAPDGNFTRSINLAYEYADGTVLALSRVGDIDVGKDGLLWVLLPDRGTITAFDKEGNMKDQVYLQKLLPWPDAVYARTANLADGSMFVLDYHQGAVLYRRGQETDFHRLILNRPAEVDSVPGVQDFAVDESGNVMLATYGNGGELYFLEPNGTDYLARRVDLKLPEGEHRLACRYSNGRFIVWLRDSQLVYVLEVRQ
ncbi:hypothetical protein KDL30_15045 [bacterium]|nr:hypothetical protein [bacterium]